MFPSIYCQFDSNKLTKLQKKNSYSSSCTFELNVLINPFTLHRFHYIKRCSEILQDYKSPSAFLQYNYTHLLTQDGIREKQYVSTRTIFGCGHHRSKAYSNTVSLTLGNRPKGQALTTCCSRVHEHQMDFWKSTPFIYLFSSHSAEDSVFIAGL